VNKSYVESIIRNSKDSKNSVRKKGTFSLSNCQLIGLANGSLLFIVYGYVSCEVLREIVIDQNNIFSDIFLLFCQIFLKDFFKYFFNIFKNIF
jgi:hypothetical protein